MYKPLRKKILEAMDGNDWIDVDRRKRELHKQYLEFTNAKVASLIILRPPFESYFSFSQPKHNMLWELLPEHPKHMFKLMSKKLTTILHSKCSLSGFTDL